MIRYGYRLEAPSKVAKIASSVRCMTMLCSDVVGAKQLALDLNENDYLKVLEDHYEKVRNVAMLQSGTVLPAQNDEVLMVFSEFKHAVNAAVEIRKTFIQSKVKPSFGVYEGEFQFIGDGSEGVYGPGIVRSRNLAKMAAPLSIVTASDSNGLNTLSHEQLGMSVLYDFENDEAKIKGVEVIMEGVSLGFKNNYI